MSEYKMKPGKIGEKVIDAYKNVEEKFADTFLEEDGSMKTGGMAEKVNGIYKKVEDSVVGGYQKMEDAFVDAFLEKSDKGDPADTEHTKK